MGNLLGFIGLRFCQSFLLLSQYALDFLREDTSRYTEYNKSTISTILETISIQKATLWRLLKMKMIFKIDIIADTAWHDILNPENKSLQGQSKYSVSSPIRILIGLYSSHAPFGSLQVELFFMSLVHNDVPLSVTSFVDNCEKLNTMMPKDNDSMVI